MEPMGNCLTQSYSRLKTFNSSTEDGLCKQPKIYNTGAYIITNTISGGFLRIIIVLWAPKTLF